MAVHEVLSKALGCLEASGRGGGSEGTDPRLPQTIDQPGGQGGIRTDDHEVDLLLPSQGNDSLKIPGLNGDVFRQGCGARIAGSTKEAPHPRGLLQLPHQGVLAPTTADD